MALSCSIIAQPQHSSWTLPPGVIAQTSFSLSPHPPEGGSGHETRRRKRRGGCDRREGEWEGDGGEGILEVEGIEARHKELARDMYMFEKIIDYLSGATVRGMGLTSGYK